MMFSLTIKLLFCIHIVLLPPDVDVDGIVPPKPCPEYLVSIPTSPAAAAAPPDDDEDDEEAFNPGLCDETLLLLPYVSYIAGDKSLDIDLLLLLLFLPFILLLLLCDSNKLPIVVLFDRLL